MRNITVYFVFSTLLFSKILDDLNRSIFESLESGSGYIYDPCKGEHQRFIGSFVELSLCFADTFSSEVVEVNKEASYFKGLCRIDKIPDAQINIRIKEIFGEKEVDSLIEIPIELSADGDATILERSCPDGTLAALKRRNMFQSIRQMSFS